MAESFQACFFKFCGLLRIVSELYTKKSLIFCPKLDFCGWDLFAKISLYEMQGKSTFFCECLAVESSVMKKHYLPHWFFPSDTVFQKKIGLAVCIVQSKQPKRFLGLFSRYDSYSRVVSMSFFGNS